MPIPKPTTPGTHTYPSMRMLVTTAKRGKLSTNPQSKTSRSKSISFNIMIHKKATPRSKQPVRAL